MEQKVKFSIEDVGGDAKDLSFSSTNPTMSRRSNSRLETGLEISTKSIKTTETLKRTDA